MSSFVSASLGDVAAAAQQLTGIGSSITSANTVAAGSTTQVAVAAQDEVSAAIAALFSGHAQEFQAVSAQAAAFHSQFVQTLNGARGAYSLTEAANLSTLNSPAADRGLDPVTTFVFDRGEELVDHTADTTVKLAERSIDFVANLFGF
jgi:hypothetical protein